MCSSDLGQRFGKLTVIEETDERKHSGRFVWECRCDCGNKVKVSSLSLLNGNTQSCGCGHKEARILNLVGQKFGRLTVIAYIGTDNYHRSNWKCKCDCGNYTTSNARSLISGQTQSCGCLAQEINKKRIKQDHRISEEKYWVENTSLPTLTAKLSVNNKSGIKGVYWDKKNSKWRVQITFQGITHRLGSFDKLEDATEARKEAEEKYFKPILEKYGRDK